MQDIFEKLKSCLQLQKIKYSDKKLKKVCEYAFLKYADKKRYSNITLMEHTLGVALEVIEMKLDEDSVYAAILHEVVKLDDYNKKEVSELFGADILQMIETISKLSCLNYGFKENLDSETFRKMFLAIGRDIRTVIIKLIDRLYNMRNIKEFENKTYRQNMAKESLYIYAPIAHRLGMSQLKSELEDISFRELYPAEYNEIKQEIDEKKKIREQYIKDRISEIESVLRKEKIEATVYGRPKHFYSIYKKMKQKKCRAEDLFDLLAIRIIVGSVKDCYSALGLIHDMYKPLPGRFKDYIAVPKTNMYQSLHTTVFGENSRPFEVQIRTWDMHKIAEYGIAAHFSYKEKKQGQDELDKKIVWLRQMIELQQGVEQKEDDIERLKSELFGQEVFVFTPKGDIFSLPKGSSTIDFAYRIHQKVGEKMVGAKINSKMVPISTKLQNTDIVEIVTQDSSKGPIIDWLNYVKTTNAKNKITSFLKKQNKDENILKGKELFEKEIKRVKIPKEELLSEKNILILLKRYSYHSIEDCYENIGFGSITSKKLVHKLIEIYKEVNADKILVKEKSANYNSKKDIAKSLVTVKGIDNCLIKFARCCNPIPGDSISGYITYSNGVSIHRNDCKNLKNLNLSNRMIEVSWKEKLVADFETSIVIYANTSNTVLSDVITKLSELKVRINDIHTKITMQKETIIYVTVSVQDSSSLQGIIRNLRKVDSVYDVKRVK